MAQDGKTGGIVTGERVVMQQGLRWQGVGTVEWISADGEACSVRWDSGRLQRNIRTDNLRIKEYTQDSPLARTPVRPHTGTEESTHTSPPRAGGNARSPPAASFVEVSAQSKRSPARDSSRLAASSPTISTPTTASAQVIFTGLYLNAARSPSPEGANQSKSLERNDRRSHGSNNATPANQSRSATLPDYGPSSSLRSEHAAHSSPQGATRAWHSPNTADANLMQSEVTRSPPRYILNASPSQHPTTMYTCHNSASPARPHHCDSSGHWNAMTGGVESPARPRHFAGDDVLHRQTGATHRHSMTGVATHRGDGHAGDVVQCSQVLHDTSVRPTIMASSSTELQDDEWRTLPPRRFSREGDLVASEVLHTSLQSPESAVGVAAYRNDKAMMYSQRVEKMEDGRYRVLSPSSSPSYVFRSALTANSHTPNRMSGGDVVLAPVSVTRHYDNVYRPAGGSALEPHSSSQEEAKRLGASPSLSFAAPVDSSASNYWEDKAMHAAELAHVPKASQHTTPYRHAAAGPKQEDQGSASAANLGHRLGSQLGISGVVQGVFLDFAHGLRRSMGEKMKEGQRLVRARDYVMRRRVLALWRERTHYMRVIARVVERAFTRLATRCMGAWAAAARQRVNERMDAVRASTLASMQQELAVVRAESEVLRRRVADREEALGHVASDADVVRGEREALITDIAGIRLQLDAARREVLAAKRQGAESADLVEEMRESSKEQLLRMDALAASNTALSAEVAALRGRAERAEQMAQDAVRDRGQAISEVGMIKATLRTTQEERDMVKRDCAAAREAEREAREVVVALLGDCAALETEFRDKLKLVESTQTRLARRDKECHDLRARLRVLEKACRDTQKALDESHQGEESTSERIGSQLQQDTLHKSILTHTSSSSPSRGAGDGSGSRFSSSSSPPHIENATVRYTREERLLAETAARHRELASRFGVPFADHSLVTKPTLTAALFPGTRMDRL